VTHAVAPLHVHWPAVHPSPLFPQVWQVPPSVPHDPGACDMHTPPEQQPFGHDAASQTHLAPLHSSPDPHAAAPPHVHVPVDEQPSAPGPHGKQPEPIGPHAVAPNVVQTEPLQQPVEHDVALQFVHVPALQIWLSHELHVFPPVPHASIALPGMHVDPLQQPVEHDVESHTQLPPEQCCPLEQAGPPPQVQAPPEEHPSPVAPHDWQALASVPHAGPVVGDTHVPSVVQHPLAHEVLSQTQLWSRQCCPVAHAAAAPQLQPPVGEQLSDSVGLQSTHALPSVPQVDIPDVMQAPLEQQPLGHDVELQTHAPFAQISPVGQGALVPHLQAPPVQRSAWVDEQTEHATPPVPQVAVAGVSHTAPLQHPFGHVALQLVHALLTQFAVDPQGLHADPPLPQSVLDVPARHVVPEQHPAQDVELQTHLPPTHA
jgi:hypothetical protein